MKPHPMRMGVEAAREELLTHIAEAGDNEVRMLLFVARRWVDVGQRAYGKLELGRGRDWQREKLEEQADRLFYDTAADFEGHAK